MNSIQFALPTLHDKYEEEEEEVELILRELELENDREEHQGGAGSEGTAVGTGGTGFDHEDDPFPRIPSLKLIISPRDEPPSNSQPRDFSTAIWYDGIPSSYDDSDEDDDETREARQKRQKELEEIDHIATELEQRRQLQRREEEIQKERLYQNALACQAIRDEHLATLRRQRLGRRCK